MMVQCTGSSWLIKMNGNAELTPEKARQLGSKLISYSFHAEDGDSSINDFYYIEEPDNDEGQEIDALRAMVAAAKKAGCTFVQRAPYDADSVECWLPDANDTLDALRDVMPEYEGDWQDWEPGDLHRLADNVHRILYSDTGAPEGPL